MRKLLRYTALNVTIISALALVVSYLSGYIRPERIWLAAFFGLAFPYLLVWNFFLFIYFSILQRKMLIIPLATILIGAGYVGRIVRIQPGFPGVIKRNETKTITTDTLSILSYNVRAFNLYDWAHNTKAAHGIIDFISSSATDIVCFQEFYSRAAQQLQLKEISSAIIAPHVHYHYYFTDKKGGKYGIATYSKYPILNKGAITFDKTFNVAIYTDILWNNDTIRIYNNHLQSVRFRKANYDFIDTLKFNYNEKQMNEIKDISSRLKTAYIKRSRQVDMIAAHIRQCPYPVIVCGDFNDTPISYTYQQMRGKLKDAFIESGIGIGNTYAGNFPSFRIDYVLFSKTFRSSYYLSPPLPYSDHYPVLVQLVKP